MTVGMAAESLGKRSRVAPTRVDLRDVQTPEIVIALCGPIGSPLHEVAAALKKILERTFGYECSTIRLSHFIDTLVGGAPVRGSKYARIKWLIDHGNDLREKYGASVLADLAIREIAEERETRKQADQAKHYAPRRVCHIIDSVKNTEELETLRLVYRELMYTVGVFSSFDAREQRLLADGMTSPEVATLIDRDSGEEKDFGQTVRNVFPRADYFLRADGDSAALIETELERFLSLIFGLRVTTPTKDETAMYHAAAAARNSACLSRQVGAAITNSDGTLISIGWNDVPCFGGGVYRLTTTDRLNDHRCYNSGGKCQNDHERRVLADKVVDAILDRGEWKGPSREELAAAVLDSSIGGLIEFSRAVHAELHAMLSAGQPLTSAILYCTTYPCHYCAAHIIAAGIKLVRYIEPYRKSLAKHLHRDAISEKESETGHVRVLAYHGVAPSRYLDLFGMQDAPRKDKEGKAIERAPNEARPKVESTLESLPVLEGLVVSKLKDRNVPLGESDREERHA